MGRSRRGRGGRGYSYERREEPVLLPVRADLHVHTPFSADYQDLDATYLQILQAADAHDLTMLALTDHNTVGGIAAMRREIEDLTLLEDLDRLSADEAQILAEYRRLLDRILVLPGVEFSAAYGFHILGLFPPDTSVRHLEHLLLTLGLTEAQLDAGSAQVENTADVLTAYEIIDEFGGLVIPAHANTARGVAMQGARYGEQTRIAYTQSPLIAALEVTDLDDTTRRGSAASFNGAHTDYPRQMHLIQGSDAHRVTREGGRRDTDLGVGDRAMELMLRERSFAALRHLFASDDFTREHPYYPIPERDADPVLAARDAGPTITQAFHEQARSRRSRYRPVLKDIVAFANTNGGTIYIGLAANPNAPVVGVPLVDEAARGLRDAATRSIVPRLDVTVDIETVQGKAIIVVRVPKGPNTPYATEAGQVFVRQEAETVIALRDEIVQLVRESVRDGSLSAPATTGDRHWNTPRPVVDFDEEDSDGDAEPARQAVVRASVVAPPVISLPTTPAPLVVPRTTSTAPTPTPVPVTVAVAAPMPAPPAVVPSNLMPETPVAPAAPIASLLSPPVEQATPVDTRVDTVPGTTAPPPDPAAEDAGALAETEPHEAIEAIEAPVRAPRRRPSRARGARNTNAEDGVAPLAATDAIASPVAALSLTTADIAPPQPDTMPVYSLEPAAPSVSVRPDSEGANGGVATGQVSESAPTAAATKPAPRRRRTASKAKTAEITPVVDATAVPTATVTDAATDADATTSESPSSGAVADATETTPPTTGVEILAVEEHGDGRRYTMRDLHTGKITHDITRKSARGQWRQAILAREDRLPNEEKIIWQGARGYGRMVIRDRTPQYDLALRDANGQVHIFYAVTEDGLDADWSTIIPKV